MPNNGDKNFLNYYQNPPATTMNRTSNQITKAFEVPMSEAITIRQLSRKIHRTDSRLWQLEKAYNKELPYCLRYKFMDLPMEIAITRQKSRELKKQREEMKAGTPKENWYPRRKQQGRNNLKRSEVITMIMKECFQNNWNVKSIAAYWGWGLAPVYRRINIKSL